MPFRTDRFRQAREALNLNQRDFGDLCNINEVQISRYETGKIDPSLPRLALMASHLNVSADYLLGMTDDPHGTFYNPELSEEERLMVDTLRREGWVGVRQLLTDRIAAALGKKPASD